nr:MAG TPA: hypothetical protein [Caudoviricetes sp.]
MSGKKLVNNILSDFCFPLGTKSNEILFISHFFDIQYLTLIICVY